MRRTFTHGIFWNIFTSDDLNGVLTKLRKQRRMSGSSMRTSASKRQ
jgi:hypothetical protein